VPVRKPKLVAACDRAVDRVVSKPRSKAKASTSRASKHKTPAQPARELSKRELFAMLADAVRNTG
jgi:hypothetical protein